MSARLDPRLNAYREDLAAASLRGKIVAPSYAEGERRQVVQPSVLLRRAPRFDSPLDNEILHGEVVSVYDEQEGWAWVQLERDDYVGYAPSEALSSDIKAPTHRVSALRTYVYPAPDIKMPPLMLLSMNVSVAVAETQGRFARIESGGFIVTTHLCGLDEAVPDFVGVAERFLGTPYLWGGRTSIGIDCSGLVQIALEAAGIGCPRDTYVQEAEFGEALSEPGEMSGLRRGDLVFWPGHVGLMADEVRLVHANAHHMETSIEPLADVVTRNADPISSIKRL